MNQKHIVIDARTRGSGVGVGRYISCLLEQLQQIDQINRYTVLVEPTDRWKPESSNFTALICTYPKFTFNPLDQLSFTWFLYGLKPDLVHFAMTPQEPMLYFGRRLTTTHDLTMFRYTRPAKYSSFVHKLAMLGYRFSFWVSHRLSSRVIVPTDYVRQDITDLHPFLKDKIAVTLEASDPPLKSKSEKPAKVKKPFIMHAGSPFPHKNIDRLAEAFTLLKKDQPDLQLVLAGKKEQYFDKLEKSLKNHPHSKDIIIPGFVSDGELKWLYENTSAYVLPSLSEGFGLPGLEAMVHGAPVASSNATCLPEVYGDAAEYFDPLDIQSMAVVINKIIEDPKIADKLRTLGHKQVSLYSWKKMAKQTLDIYNELLKRPDNRQNF